MSPRTPAPTHAEAARKVADLVALAEHEGIHMEPWQVDVLASAMSHEGPIRLTPRFRRRDPMADEALRLFAALFPDQVRLISPSSAAPTHERKP